MAGETTLRRWKRFLPTFDAIDAAVEVSDPAVRRTHDKIRRARGQIVEALRRAPDDGVAEELCLLLDDAMAESLVTLQAAPVTASALASTDLARAVAALGQDESARIRRLARDVVRGWRASVEGDIARARAAMEALDKLTGDKQLPPEDLSSVVAQARSSHVPIVAGEGEKKQAKDASCTKKTASVIGSNRIEQAKIIGSAKVPASLPKKSAPAVGAGRANATNIDKTLPKKMPAVLVGNGGGDHVGCDKLEATKRKLHEGYQEAADAKRQRKIERYCRIFGVDSWETHVSFSQNQVTDPSSLRPDHLCYALVLATAGRRHRRGAGYTTWLPAARQRAQTRAPPPRRMPQNRDASQVFFRSLGRPRTHLNELT
ncbi:hypothetical protein ACP70R_043941 [Stipagrostis hirtigluma subsp. patula]